MSHFVTLVILPNKEKDNIDTKLTELFAPYDENMEVEEYLEECWCVGAKASNEVREAIEDQLGDLQIHRDWFARIRKTAYEKAHAGVPEDKRTWFIEEIEQPIDAQWKKEVWQPRDELKNKLMAEHPEGKSPDAGCEECNGTGQRPTTYNPKSKWDWWVVGGRWDGSIQKNQRSSDNGFNFGPQHRELGNNIAPTEFLLDNLFVPFAILTPDGEWHERGEMCWFAVVANEKDGVCWEDTVFQIYGAYPNHFAVACDLHI